MRVWVLLDPKGRPVRNVLDYDRRRLWALAYPHIASVDPDFGRRYWKKWDASQRAARRKGWRVARAMVVVED